MQIRGGKLQYDNHEKNKKITKIILICIILVFILMIAVMCTIMYLQKSILHVYINGKSVNFAKDTVIIDEQTGKIHVDITGIANSLGYDYHKGEFKLYTEDENKCWVECEEETASFFLNSNKISKVVPDQTKDYEDYTITDPVIRINDKLYCTPEGIKIGFNVMFDYNQKTNSIEIYTLPYLVENYTKQFKDLGYKDRH